jgi:hypothetical protein
VVLGAFATPARAGSYRVWSCTDGAGRAAPVTDGQSGWFPDPSPSGADLCGTAGDDSSRRFLYNELWSRPYTLRGWAFIAPGATRITRAELWWQGWVAPGAQGRIVISNDGVVYTPVLLHTAPFGGDSPYDAANYADLPNLGALQVEADAWCPTGGDPGAGPPCYQDPPSKIAWLKIYRARLTLADNAAPTGRASDGGLIDEAPLRGRASVTVTGHDDGGGLYLVRVLDGAGIVAQTTFPGASCAPRDAGDPYAFASPKPCPTDASAAVTVDTTRLAEGVPHRIRVQVLDAAGNAITVLDRQVFVDNLSDAPAFADGAAPPGFYDRARRKWFNPDANWDAPRRPNGQRAGTATPTLRFAKRTRSRRHRTRIKYARTRIVTMQGRPTVVGRLRDGARHAIAGARVWLGECAKGGTCRITGGPFLTSRRGRFATRLAAGRPTRRVHLLYFPWTDSNEVYSARPIRLRVRARVTLHITPDVVRNGQSIRFAGGLHVPTVPAHVTGALQVLDGQKWRTFKSVRISSDGRFEAHYRFRRSFNVRYRFRTRVSGAQTGMRYESGISPIIPVTVR